MRHLQAKITFAASMAAGRVLKSLMVKRVREEKDCGTLNREYFRSQTLLAQKPKRVGQLANVGAKVRYKNETAKLFGNFLLFNCFAFRINHNYPIIIHRTHVI